MKTFKEYLEKAQRIDEFQLQPNQVEIVGKNVYGTLKGQDLSDPNVAGNVGKFIAWLKANMPEVLQQINAKGGMKVLIGNKMPPADIQLMGTDAAPKIAVNPDA